MFEIKELPETEGRYLISFKGKPLEEAYYDDNVLFMWDFPEFNVNEIAGMKLADFPEHFSFNITIKKPYESFLNFMMISRNGKKATINMHGMLDLNNDRLEWLYWNPVLFMDTAVKLMKKKRIGISKTGRYNTDPPSLSFDFNFSIETTVGSALKICEQRSSEIIRETELLLMKRVEKKLKK
jgi:hypothetical protein